MTHSTFAIARHALAALTCALACVGARAQAPADERPVLRLAPLAHATVGFDRVTLRDVVAVVQDDADAAPRLLSLDLGPAPRVGQPVRLVQAQLAEWVRRYRPSAAVRVEWSGPEAVDVERASQTLSQDDLDPLARGELESWLARRSEAHVVELVGTIAPVAVPLGRVSLSVRPLPRVPTPSAHATVWVDVSVAGHFQRSVSIDYRVQAFRTAWVAAEELERGQDVDATRVAQSKVDAATLSNALWTDSPERMRMRRTVHRGEPLTTLDVELRPYVVRGERVEVFSRVGELSIEVQAEALQDGKAGQDVLVRIASSRSPVTARVLKPGLVEIRQ